MRRVLISYFFSSTAFIISKLLFLFSLIILLASLAHLVVPHDKFNFFTNPIPKSTSGWMASDTKQGTFDAWASNKTNPNPS